MPTETLAAVRVGHVLRAGARHGSSKSVNPKFEKPSTKARQEPTSTGDARLTSSSPSVPASAMASSPAAASKLSRAASQSLHLAVENAYLNWVRNGITATALGMAFIHFRVVKDDAQFSIGGAVLQAMGAAYVALGAVSYLASAFWLRAELALTSFGIAWYGFNAAWPVIVYAIGMLCILDQHPSWFLALLAQNIDRLPEGWQDRCLSVVGAKTRREENRDHQRRRLRKEREDKW
jgi:uncharacterized membrane protein YidH (DUF202 family)